MDAVALAMVEALPAVAPTIGWTTLGTLPTGRYDAAASTDGTRAYVTHGYDATNGPTVSGFSLVPSPYTVTTLPSAPGPARNAVAGTWSNAKHYAFGGFISGGGVTGTVESYTPAGTNGASGIWSTAATMPTAVAYTSATSLGQYAYVAGGQTGAAASSAVNTFQRYDTSSNTWTTLANMPAARSRGAFVTVGTKLFYLSGTSTSGSANAGVFVFDTTAGTWSSGTALTQGYVSVSGVTVNSLVYLVSDTEIRSYDPNAGTTSTTLGAYPTAHGTGIGAVAISSSVYAVSGSNTANVDKLDLGAGAGYTTAVLGVKSLLNSLLAGVASALPNTPPTVTADRTAYAQTVQTLKALAAL